MSRRWFRALEILGRIRLRAPFRWRRALRVGDPTARDARDGDGWRQYLSAERLFDVWGPLPGSSWVPFHSVPLFAALDSLRHEEIGPARPAVAWQDAPAWTSGGAPDAVSPEGTPPSPAGLPPAVRPGAPAPEWLQRDTWTILDLPGPLAVEAAAWLVTSAGCQPVCTFDNWPHARGVIKAERTLAELLRWATTIAIARRDLEPASPPVWICDSERMGTTTPTPGEFDNRYFLDDSVLPGPVLLRGAGIRQVVYATLRGDEAPLADLDGFFKDLLTAGIPVLQVGLASPTRQPAPISLPAVPRQPPTGFRRSGAGGFGQDVPQPSSGGGG
jgi:hypothetical protein